MTPTALDRRQEDERIHRMELRMDRIEAELLGNGGIKEYIIQRKRDEENMHRENTDKLDAITATQAKMGNWIQFGILFVGVCAAIMTLMSMASHYKSGDLVWPVHFKVDATPAQVEAKEGAPPTTTTLIDPRY